MSAATEIDHLVIVRLNAQVFPQTPYEAAVCRQYGLDPVLVEANTPEAILRHAGDSDAIMGVSVRLSAKVIDHLSRCRVISRIGTGTDNIDVAAATSRGILVTNVPTFCVQEQADHTIMFLLALARKLPQMEAAMVCGTFSEARRACSTIQRFSEQVLGLIGFGNSAQATAARAISFGLRVLATRRNMNASRHEADKLGVTMVDLDTLLAESDYVSLHCPLNDQTHHLLDREALGRMKPGACLINTARGRLVDEAALVEGLRSGRIAGAGIDTFTHINPFPEVEAAPDDPLLSLENVILTPHVGSMSEQSFQDVRRGALENVVAVLSGRWPDARNIINGGVKPRFALS